MAEEIYGMVSLGKVETLDGFIYLAIERWRPGKSRLLERLAIL